MSATISRKWRPSAGSVVSRVYQPYGAFRRKRKNATNVDVAAAVAAARTCAKAEYTCEVSRARLDTCGIILEENLTREVFHTQFREGRQDEGTLAFNYDTRLVRKKFGFTERARFRSNNTKASGLGGSCLPRDVPELQLNRGLPHHELLEREVHPYRGLVMP